MPSQKNIQLLEEAKNKVDKSTAMFFVDYQGITHQQLEEARRELKSVDSEMAVIKNTLMNLALQSKNIDAKERLQGPHATLFAYADAIKTAKVMDVFFKKNLPEGKNIADVIKFGVFEGKIIEKDLVEKLASLPSKEILIGKLLGLMKAPINNLVYNLNGQMSKFVLTLKQLKKQKERLVN